MTNIVEDGWDRGTTEDAAKCLPGRGQDHPTAEGEGHEHAGEKGSDRGRGGPRPAAEWLYQQLRTRIVRKHVGDGQQSRPTSVPTQSPSLNAEYPLTINIEIAGGRTEPNGNKIDVRVGQKVILNVISETDDEIHAHLGENDYELAVPAGKPTKGSFTLDSRGSFEVESHHLEKTIVILNAR